ncbi:hypothetical protein SAMN04489812_0204 [Microlunatus soli]|uniref:Uncharacterized protein n=1 Tax=Microlunatus soli TaxID=630515 RepID=A0A1H1MPD0_9ACTN|nr:hypothetical protein SAMN04489812_0204 [Microlunatus soli]
MATLTSSSFTRSTTIAIASRPRLTMSLPRALESIVASGVRTAAPTGIALSEQTVMVGTSAQSSQPSRTIGSGSVMSDPSKAVQVAATGAVKGHNHNSITSYDAVALLDSRKPCGVVDGQGAGISRKGAFVISLGSRPPSPPV